MHATPPPAAAGGASLAQCDVATRVSPEMLARLCSRAGDSLLESGRREHGARWTVLGLSPVASFAARGGGNRFEWRRRGESHEWREPALPALRRALAAFPAARPIAGLPFCCGAMGVLAYELGREILPLAPRAEDDLGLPVLSFSFYDRCLLFDHEEGRLRALACLPGEGPAARQAADAAARRLASDVASRIGERDEQPEAGPAGPLAPLPVRVTLSHDEYLRAVDRCREEILDGNAYELCLTTRFESTFAGDPLNLYRILRRRNPAPFAALIRHPEGALVSASPERYLRVSAAGEVEARPIKGTISRGEDAEADAVLRERLRSSEKDRAENVMIVDLLRNDLSRVCVPGTVKVAQLCAIEDHPTVFQMVSTIVGELRGDRDRVDLLEAAFPGGSMTGAPKIAAMNLLEEMEPRVRGWYSGAVGYLGFDGAMDLSIVIRGIQIVGERALVGAGGAVTFDSDPEGEWQEALQKADAPLRALAEAQGRDGYELSSARDEAIAP